MSSLKKFFVTECIFKLVCFCECCKESKYISRKCIGWKIFEQIGIGMTYPHDFLITMHEIGTATGVFLEPFQTYMIELFLQK